MRRSRAVLLDTSGWAAVLNAADRLHPTAVAVWKALGRNGVRVVVTDWIIAETGNGLARTKARDSFARAVRLLIDSPRAGLVILNETWLDRAIQLYESRPDKTWGLVDCASICLMEHEGIAEVFGADHHFEQAGFRCLLPVA